MIGMIFGLFSKLADMVFDSPIYHWVEKTIAPDMHDFICPCADA